MAKVIVFGSMNMDLSIECPRPPRDGETITGSDFIANPGGKGANQAVAAARMGADVSMIACVGDDGFGRVLLDDLAGYGVDASHVSVSGEAGTGTAMIVRCQGESSIVVCPGANHVLSARDACAALDELAEPGDVLLCQLECDLQTTAGVLVHAHERGVRTILNAAPAHHLDAAAYEVVDLLCVNETECEALSRVLPTDRWRQRDALEALRSRGVGDAIITLGRRGSVGMVAGELVATRPFAVEAVDATGAGDAYLGALAAQMAQGVAPALCLERASAAGALACTTVGAQQSMPTASEVDAFIAERCPEAGA